jgi:hypothetical protein
MRKVKKAAKMLFQDHLSPGKMISLSSLSKLQSAIVGSAMKNPWLEFAGPGYALENLGRPAVFLIPSHKLRLRLDGTTIEKHLESFLLKEFGAYTTSMVPSFGLWRDERHEVVTDESRQYEVAFIGRDRLKALIEELATIARITQEDCFYFKAGEDVCLIRPTPLTHRP